MTRGYLLFFRFEPKFDSLLERFTQGTLRAAVLLRHPRPKLAVEFVGELYGHTTHFKRPRVPIPLCFNNLLHTYVCVHQHTGGFG